MPLVVDRAALQSAGEVFENFGAAVSDLRIYGPGHPRYQGTLVRIAGLVEEYFKSHPSSRHLIFEVQGETVEFRRVPLVSLQAHGQKLAGILSSMDVALARFERGVSQEELGRWVSALAEAFKKSAKAPVLERPSWKDPKLRLVLKTEMDAASKSSRLETGLEGAADLEELSFPEFQVSEDALGAVLTTYQVLLANVEKGLNFDYSLLEKTTDQVVSLFSEQQASFLASMARGYFDDFTFHHSVNVCLLSTKVASMVVKDKELLRKISMAGLLHDIGKTRVPVEILHKPARLTPAEMAEMQKHPVSGAEILLETEGVEPLSVVVAYSHHLHGGRNAYPKVQKPYCCDWVTELISMVDIYEALTAVRPYKKAISSEKAFAVMLSMPGLRRQRSMIKMLFDFLGPYPVGEIVELSSGERGVVLAQNPLAPYAPKVRILTDHLGNRLLVPRDMDLSGAGSHAGQEPVKIVRAVIAQKAAEDPFTKADSDTSKSVLEAVGSEDVFLAREG